VTTSVAGDAASDGASTTKVTAVVVDWNGAAHSRACLQALDAIRSDAALDVLLIDNGSDDASALAALASSPRVRVLRLSSNLGFGAGSNVGIRAALDAGVDWVWLLNNDAAPEPGALAAMLAAGRRDATIGAVGCVLDEGTPGAPSLVYGGGRVRFAAGVARHHARPVPIARLDYLCAASMLVRRTALEHAGLFDERFFLYWEDVDLCVRLRGAGFRLAVADDARVRHRAHASQALASPGWDRHFTRSSVLFFRKHATLPLLPIALSAAGRIVKRLAAGRLANARAVWDGLRLGYAAGPASGDQRASRP
jgi:GT2 family glycosyltransferase